MIKVTGESDGASISFTGTQYKSFAAYDSIEHTFTCEIKEMDG